MRSKCSGCAGTELDGVTAQYILKVLYAKPAPLVCQLSQGHGFLRQVTKVSVSPPWPSSVTHPLGPNAGYLRPTAVMVSRGHRLQPEDLLTPTAPAYLRPPSSGAQSRTPGGGAWGVSLAPNTPLRPLSGSAPPSGEDSPRLGHAPPPPVSLRPLPVSFPKLENTALDTPLHPPRPAPSNSQCTSQTLGYLRTPQNLSGPLPYIQFLLLHARMRPNLGGNGRASWMVGK